MDIHIGKAILLQLKETGMSKSEFGRRIRRAPQTVQDIIRKKSIDTDLLSRISVVLEYDFFKLYSIPGDKALSGVSMPKEKATKLIAENDELKRMNSLLNKSLKDKDRIIALLEKKKGTKSKRKG